MSDLCSYDIHDVMGKYRGKGPWIRDIIGIHNMEGDWIFLTWKWRMRLAVNASFISPTYVQGIRLGRGAVT